MYQLHYYIEACGVKNNLTQHLFIKKIENITI